MIFLIILFYLFLASPVFATPQISIIDYSNSLVPDSVFPVNFLVTNTNIGATYYYKFFGGIGDSTSSIKTTATLSYNTAWSNFPTFITDLGGSAQINSTAYLIPDALAGNYNLKIRIALTSNTSSGVTSPSFPLTVVIPTATPTPFDSPEPTTPAVFDTPEPTIPAVTPTVFVSPLILSELMANPDTGQDEWIEIYNPSDESISLKNLCFYDASNHSRCFADTDVIAPKSYFSHSISSGFLNNDGDTVNFLNTSVIYPKSPKNFSYSRQENNSWCFSTPSLNAANNDCVSATVSDSTETIYTPPLLSLQFIPSSVNAGDDFNLVFSLNSSDQYFLRIIYPFGSQYFPFTNYHDGYSWLTMPLSTSKKLPPGNYPLSFHLKKNDSSHLYDYQLGNLVVKEFIDNKKTKVLGAVSKTTIVQTTPKPLNCPPQISTINPVIPDLVFFSWPFLFAGSILFLSPILFPKLYAA